MDGTNNIIIIIAERPLFVWTADIHGFSISYSDDDDDDDDTLSVRLWWWRGGGGGRVPDGSVFLRRFISIYRVYTLSGNGGQCEWDRVDAETYIIHVRDTRRVHPPPRADEKTDFLALKRSHLFDIYETPRVHGRTDSPKPSVRPCAYKKYVYNRNDGASVDRIRPISFHSFSIS